MAFKPASLLSGKNFNTAQSLTFLEEYERFRSDKVRAERAAPSHRCFAPSSLRCDRLSWFRLRGVQPDSISQPDMSLEFTAEIGTACHRIIQSNLAKMLGDDWINVEEYVGSLGISATTQYDATSGEVLITIDDPPVRFACDGIIRRDNKLYLLEIKTVDVASWGALSTEKPQHRDQVICYCSLLQLNNVLFLYQERTYGGLKCFELSVPNYLQLDMMDRMNKVMEKVRQGIAPKALPRGDSWCTPGRCPYYKTCQEYGRYE